MVILKLNKKVDYGFNIPNWKKFGDQISSLVNNIYS
jgi:hypothetical protein